MTDVTSEPSCTTTIPAPRSELARVRLTGQVERLASFTVAELRDLPQRTVETEFLCAREGRRRHTFTGPLLIDLVSAAGPRFDPMITKDRVRFLLAVRGADGHTTVLSWGEIDPRYGRTEAMLATAMDGRTLDADGPHLAVPGDVAGGRYVSRVTGIWVGAADALTAT
ncbi:molybdopterin-dependent oxidoreductase [Actinoallomurus acaciae]|uniref:Molybdopterin-dependent oxidoreductase n=1 Tax=Actinoallomurus acaciae TaxID=502577 RepID=A0ABV5YGV5_9ACTN